MKCYVLTKDLWWDKLNCIFSTQRQTPSTPPSFFEHPTQSRKSFASYGSCRAPMSSLLWSPDVELKKKNGRIANREEAVSIVQRRLPRYCCHRDKMHLQGFFFLSLSAQALQLSDLERTAGTSLPEKKNWATLARTLIPPWHLLSMQVTEDFCLFWVSLFIKVIFCL